MPMRIGLSGTSPAVTRSGKGPGLTLVGVRFARGGIATARLETQGMGVLARP